MTKKSDLRTKSILLKRQHILSAALRVFAQSGFHRATVHHVAVEAGVADGTIYTFFENKTALLIGILEATPKPSPPVEHQSSPVSPAAIVRLLIERQWQALTPENLSMMRVILSEVMVNADLRKIYRDRIIAPAISLPEEIFAGFVASSELVSADLGMTLRIITGAFFGLVMMRLLGDDKLERESHDVPERLSALLLDGMLPRESGAP